MCHRRRGGGVPAPAPGGVPAAAASALLAVTLAAATACAGTGPGDRRGSLTVLAAASLTEPFARIGADFEAAHPGVRVEFSFAGSAQLAQQICSGAPADVFAAADRATMQRVVSAGDAAGPPRLFARNHLVIALAEGNPEAVDELADLVGLKVALCAPQVPCGAAARLALAAAGVAVTAATLEQDVKAALAKVRLGEVDAALVYRTDVPADDPAADAVEFAQSAGAANDYPIVVLTGAGDPAGAETFVNHVLSEPGRRVLAAAGFQLP